MGLRRTDLDPDPVVQFQRWFAQMAGERASGRLRGFLIDCYKRLLMLRRIERVDLNAMTLATVDADGRPSARMVLLKGVDPRGFVFYTNYSSRKGRELEANPYAALVFYWPGQERQVCVTGSVARLPPPESDTYFRSRPRGSRIGAWASAQSQPTKDRAALEESWSRFEARFPGEDIPRPDHWGGYLLSPVRFEFWQGRPNRLHDRFQYLRRPDQSWEIQRLAP